MNPANDPPPDDERFGPIQSEFRATGWSQVGRGCLGAICVSIGVASVVACGVGLLTGRTAELLHILAFGVMFFTGGVALLRSVRKAGGTRVEVFSRGLILREERDAQACRWEDILCVVEKEAVNQEDVIQESTISEARAFHLHLRSGRVIVLKSYLQGLARLGTIVKRETLPLLLPGYLSDLREGRTVEFGAIRLDRDGLEVRQQVLPWAEVRRMCRKGGWLVIDRRDAWLTWNKVKLAEVPDAHVLLELVAQHIGT